MSSPFPDCVPVLSDGVVTLRAHRTSDAQALVEQCNDPAMVDYTTVPRPYGHTQAQEFLGGVVPRGWETAYGTKSWAIEAKDEDGVPRFAGSIDYRPSEVGTAEVGFGLHPWARGRGLMSRALRLVVAHAFDLGTETMHWRAVVGNWGSRRVAWACGFRVEGTVRDLLVAQPRGRRDGWIGSLRRGEPTRPAHRWCDPVVLEGRSVRLRPWREGDRPLVAFDPTAVRFMGPALPPGDAAGFAQWLLRSGERMARGELVAWCVADLATDRALGELKVFGLDDPFTRGSAEVGYWLHRRARGRGVLHEALGLAAGHAFAAVDDGGLGLHRLGAGTDLDNEASQRVLRRAGFRLIGVERESASHEDGPPTDGALFELLADDDREAAPQLPPLPELTGERIRLRAWRESDAPALLSAATHPGFGGTPPARDEDEARRWVATRRRRHFLGEAIPWAVADLATDTAIGAVTLHRLDEPLYADSAELGYWLHPDRRGEGLANEALDLVIPWALSPVAEGGLGRRRITARTDPANTASQTVLRRAGLTEWGREPQARPPAGGEPARAVVHFEVTRDNDRIAAAALQQAGTVEVPTIQGRDAPIRLRAWRDEDAQQVQEACSDPVSQHWLSGLPRAYRLDQARAYLEHCRQAALGGSMLVWCVSEDRTDACIGAISVMGLHEDDPTSGEIGYWTHPQARGRGVMTEATRLAVRHAFLPRDDGGLGLRRLRLNVASGNEASAAIALRNGFVEVGRDRLAEPLGDGTFVDLIRFDQLAADWGAAPFGPPGVRP